jgi:hypothetical protein
MPRPLEAAMRVGSADFRAALPTELGRGSLAGRSTGPAYKDWSHY